MVIPIIEIAGIILLIIGWIKLVSFLEGGRVRKEKGSIFRGKR
jgi:hypothetical protein